MECKIINPYSEKLGEAMLQGWGEQAGFLEGPESEAASWDAG